MRFLLLTSILILSVKTAKFEDLETIGSELKSFDMGYQTRLLCPTWYTPAHNNDSNIWCECHDNIILGGSVIKCPVRSEVCLTCEEMEGFDSNDYNVSILTGFYDT